jgi:molecular chaperone GrpE
MDNNKENFEKNSGGHEPEFENVQESDESISLAAQHKAEIARVKQEADDNYTLYLRTLADAENGRKRLVKEVENSKKFALEAFFKEILVVLDGFEKALASQESTESNSFGEGVAIVRKQLVEILERNGLQEIPAKGMKFDPNLHQAIKRTESSEVSEETIDCEYAKGYKMFDKLLRPSIVSVLVPSA